MIDELLSKEIKVEEIGNFIFSIDQDGDLTITEYGRRLSLSFYFGKDDIKKIKKFLEG